MNENRNAASGNHGIVAGGNRDKEDATWGAAETPEFDLWKAVTSTLAVILIILAFLAFMVGGTVLLGSCEKGCPSGTTPLMKRMGSINRGVVCVPNSSYESQVRASESRTSAASMSFGRDTRRPDMAEWLRSRERLSPELRKRLDEMLKKASDVEFKLDPPSILTLKAGAEILEEVVVGAGATPQDPETINAEPR